MTNLLAKKKGLVIGVANDKSIAWGIAKVLAENGASLAFTYQGDSFGKRVVPLAESLGSNLVFNVDVQNSKSLDLVFSKIQSFDSAILGVGDDGHIASLFPNTNALNDESIKFVANEVNILSKWRVTSTFQLLAEIKNVFLLVTGENKSDILKKIGRDNGLPVNELIKRRKKTTLVTDQKI